jgi:hypothetical protein
MNASSRLPGPTAQTRANSVTTLSPAGHPAQIHTPVLTSARLSKALLPAQELGASAVVTQRPTGLSQFVGLCAAPLSSGAKAGAGEVVKDTQTGQLMEEVLIDWDSAADAGASVAADRSAVDETGSCSFSSDWVTQVFNGDDTGVPPQECGAGQYLGTQASIPDWFSNGYVAEAQCGSFEIEIMIIGNASSAGAIDQDVNDGYLNTAVGTLKTKIPSPAFPAGWSGRRRTRRRDSGRRPGRCRCATGGPRACWGRRACRGAASTRS